MNRMAALVVVAALVGASCASDATPDATTDAQIESVETVDETTDTETTNETSTEDAASVEDAAFQIEVWADNWSAVYVDGELIGEDSVPITTERSFNAETFTFDTALPFTIAIEAKDFKETDSGIEYIGQQNQQMGDGGIIAQVTNLSTGEVVAVTSSDWKALVVHQAPLNTDCEDDPDPDSTCEFLIVETPANWTSAEFDDSDWASATEWTATDVDPKDGYNEISWDATAQLIWGTDLEIDNTVLLRTTVS